MIRARVKELGRRLERLLQFAPSDRSKRELGWQTFVLETASDLVNASEKKSSSLVFDTLQTWETRVACIFTAPMKIYTF
jgi:hypothetical protein